VKLVSPVGQQPETAVRVDAGLTFARQQFVSADDTHRQQRLFGVVSQRQTDRPAVLLLYPPEQLLVAQQLHTPPHPP